MPGDKPPDPIGPPKLVRGKNPGEFTVDLSEATPKPEAGQVIDIETVEPVAFLFQFEDVNLHDVFFNWIVSVYIIT